jgi:hypothetical protein
VSRAPDNVRRSRDSVSRASVSVTCICANLNNGRARESN